MSAGGAHAVAIRADGTLWAWGYNFYGQLGDGTQANRHTPEQVGTGTDWVSVAAGGAHTLAIRADGTLWAWGDNEDAEVGNGQWGNSIFHPTQIGTTADWASISAGCQHSIAIRADGTLWAWGYDRFGQSGDSGGALFQLNPKKVDAATNWSAAAAGGDHTMAIRSDGTLWGWGDNQHGQLGDGTGTSARATPERIGNSKAWTGIEAGYDFSIGVRAGTLWAWGNNTYGELGDGTTASRLAPEQIGTTRSWHRPGEVGSCSEHSVALAGS